MNRPVEPVTPEIESLLVVERQLVPAASEFRTRAVERARAALPRGPSARYWNPRRSSRPRPMRIVAAAAAGLMLVALGAAAFRAMDRDPIEVTPTPPAAVLPRMPEPPRAVPPANPAEANDVAAPPIERHARAKVTAPAARSASDSEAYAIELRLLQPAHQAVARRDFAFAITSIAEHQRRFPAGQLVEEREALRVKVLLGLGRVAEAQRAGAAFRARFPRSVLLRRIDGMLEAAPTP